MLHSKMSKPTGALLGEGKIVKELQTITTSSFLWPLHRLIAPVGSTNTPLALLFHSWESHSLGIIRYALTTVA